MSEKRKKKERKSNSYVDCSGDERPERGDDISSEGESDEKEALLPAAREMPKTSWKWLAVLAVSALSMIALITVAAVVYMCVHQACCLDKKVESTLLASGLGIISIAIAVWAGLNIVNEIQRKEISQLQDTTRSLEERVARANLRWFGNQSDAMRSMFLQELMRTQTDSMSAHFYGEFSAEKRMGARWDKLVDIERLFADVYEMHGGSAKMNQLLRDRAEMGISKIHAYCKKQTKLESEYLRFREAEFCFYKGYIETADASFRSYRAAIRSYQEYWNAHLEAEIDPDAEFPDQFAAKRELAAYLANTIGEAYEKVLQRYNVLKLRLAGDDEALAFLEESKKQAVRYGECAVRWSNKTTYEKNEVIYRNLGCSYEGLDKANQNDEHEREIFKYYQAAFRLMADDPSIKPSRMLKVYHVLLTYYMRYAKRKIPVTVKEGKAVLGGADYSGDTCKRIEEFIDYADFAQTDGKHNHFLIVMRGFAYFFAGVAIGLGEQKIKGLDVSKCAENVDSAVAALQLLQCNDDYARMLAAEQSLLYTIKNG